MAFIPLVGVPFGVAAIVWGFVTRRAGGRKLALVGALGIFFTITLYSGLFYFGFVQRGGIYDDLRRQLAQTTINDLVAAIELYKTQRGNYPANLSELRGSLAPNSFVSIGDPSRLFADSEPAMFHYELTEGGGAYYLLGVGADGTPFTADDILPTIANVPGSRVGLRIRSQSR